MLGPKIPPTASEFCAMLPAMAFGDYYKFSVTCGNQTAVVFFSDKMTNFLTEVTSIQFNGTFFTVPIQFFQLWTIFVAVGRHTLPAIHCLMTAKSQDLYQAILENISVNIPLFQPSSSMSDWEPAARIAFRNVAGFISLSEFGLKHKNLGSVRVSETLTKWPHVSDN